MRCRGDFERDVCVLREHAALAQAEGERSRVAHVDRDADLQVVGEEAAQSGREGCSTRVAHRHEECEVVLAHRVQARKRDLVLHIGEDADELCLVIVLVGWVSRETDVRGWRLRRG